MMMPSTCPHGVPLTSAGYNCSICNPVPVSRFVDNGPGPREIRLRAERDAARAAFDGQRTQHQLAADALGAEIERLKLECEAHYQVNQEQCREIERLREERRRLDHDKWINRVEVAEKAAEKSWAEAERLREELRQWEARFDATPEEVTEECNKMDADLVALRARVAALEEALRGLMLRAQGYSSNQKCMACGVVPRDVPHKPLCEIEIARALLAAAPAPEVKTP